MQRCGALAALLALAAGRAGGQRDDAVSLLQSAAQGASQSHWARAWHLQDDRWGEDTRSQTFAVGEVAYVKSHRHKAMGGWIICSIIGPAHDPNTYDVVVPGTAVLKGIPALMLRKKKKDSAISTTTPPEDSVAELAAIGGSIDGEPGEQVEVIIRKGSKAGSWVPGWIEGSGTLPDTFDIKVISSKDSTFKFLRNVPGANLRKRRLTTTLSPDDVIAFKVGDRVDILEKGGDPWDDNSWHPAVIAAPGKSPDTWTVYVNLIGYEPDVPKVALRHPKKEVMEQGPAASIKEPELSDAMYEVGEDVESKVVAGGKLSGFWLKARIVEIGTVPWTYVINCTESKLTDMAMIPIFHELLRRPNSNYRRAAQTSFELGEPVEFKAFTDPDNFTAATRWWNATIVAVGEAADTYDILEPSGEKLISYPVELIRKTYFNESWLPRVASTVYRSNDTIQYKNFLSGMWNDGRILNESDVPGTYEIDSGDITKQVTTLHQIPIEMLRRPATSFHVGDHVEVEGKKGNETIYRRGVVTATGPEDDMYDVFVPDSSATGIVKGVRFKKMIQASPVPPKFLMKAYEVGEKVEMKVMYGAGAGTWVPAKVAGRGGVLNTYDVLVSGLGLTPNVPIELLRKVSMSRFKIGEFARVRLAAGPLVGQWMEGLVSGRGTMPDMFNITYWGGGLVPNVPIELMQKINKPFRLEDMPYFEVGSNVQVRCLIGPDKGKYIPGLVQKQQMILNSTDGPRPQLYTLSLPTYPEIGEIKDVPVELMVKDELALRPLALYVDLKVNDTVQLKGMIGHQGAPWIRVYISKPGTKRDTYDIHLPGVGIFNDIPVELLRRHGTITPTVTYQVDQEVEMKDIFDLGEDNKLWIPCTIMRPGVRPDTYDCGVPGTKIVIESVPFEILRPADGKELLSFAKVYFPGEIVETKDILGIIATNATSKVVFKILGEGKMHNTYDIIGPHIGVIENVPVVLLKKVTAEDIESLDTNIYAGDLVDCKEIEKPGSITVCRVESAGDRPNTWNIRIPGYQGIFPNIPVSRLHKKPIGYAEATTTMTPKSGPKDMKVGDYVEVFDRRRKEEQWVEGVIIGQGTSRRTFDVKTGEEGVFRNVPLDKLRKLLTEEDEALTTLTTTTTMEPLTAGDMIFYRGPGSNASDPSTWTSAKIVSRGKAPDTWDLGLKNGALALNMPAKYIDKDLRYTSTTPNPDQVFMYNVQNTLTFVMPTIKIFQEVFRKQENDHLKQELGDNKAALQKEYSGKNLGDGTVQFEVGEKAEVQITKGDYKGVWVQCVITGLGKFQNSYDIHLPQGTDGFKDIPNVGTKVLRKVGLVNDEESKRIKAASPCTEDDRMGMLKVMATEGVFGHNPEECKKVVGLWGVNADNIGSCARKKFFISAQCSRCAIDFGKEASGAGSLLKKNCLTKCTPAMQACGNAKAEPQSCVSNLGECMTCVKTPLTNLLKCIGAADSTTASKLDQLTEAATSGAIMAGGVLEGIWGPEWVSSHTPILKHFLGNLIHDAEAESPKPQTASAGQSIAVFVPGEKAEIKIQKGAYAGQWVECDISGTGKLANTYNVHIPTAPQGRQDFPDVAAAILRKTELGYDDGGASTPAPEQMAEDPL